MYTRLHLETKIIKYYLYVFVKILRPKFIEHSVYCIYVCCTHTRKNITQLLILILRHSPSPCRLVIYNILVRTPIRKIGTCVLGGLT